MKSWNLRLVVISAGKLLKQLIVLKLLADFNSQYLPITDILVFMEPDM